MRPIQITNASDGTIVNRGYSYYASTFIQDSIGAAFTFVGRREGPPLFFKIYLGSKEVERLGSLLQYPGEGEGWSWDLEGRILLCSGPKYLRVDPFDPANIEVLLDISATHPGCRLSQAHSSDDGKVHSASIDQIVQDGPYPHIATLVASRDGSVIPYPAVGTLDESQVTRDGGWLIIKQGTGGNDNFTIDLQTRVGTWVLDEEGAFGHSDCGPETVIGEVDRPEPQQCILRNLRTGAVVPLFQTSNMGHVSVRGGRCLRSDEKSLSLVAQDGSGETPVLDHGMVVPPGTPDWEKYNYQVMGNLDPSGRIVQYVSNYGTGRMDAYVAVLR